MLVVFDFTFFFHFLLFYASVATTGVALSRALRGTSAGIGERSKEEEGLMTSFGIYDLCTDFLSSVLHFLQQQQSLKLVFSTTSRLVMIIPGFSWALFVLEKEGTFCVHV